jgi:hypothetical protein
MFLYVREIRQGMYIWLNIQARSHNCSCLVKAISTTYSVVRMEENCMHRRVMYLQPEGQRKVGRPRARWSDEVGIMYLLGSSNESRRVEETSQRDQDACELWRCC